MYQVNHSVRQPQERQMRSLKCIGKSCRRHREAVNLNTQGDLVVVLCFTLAITFKERESNWSGRRDRTQRRDWQTSTVKGDLRNTLFTQAKQRLEGNITPP